MDDFAIFILTHGRADRVVTFDLLQRFGYMGRLYIVIDDEDKQGDEYRKRFGDRVLMFCKRDVASRIDEGNNFGDRRSILFARNACWDLARQVGVRYFMQLDDDYTGFCYRLSSDGHYLQQSVLVRKTFNDALNRMVDLMRHVPLHSVATSQGGDWIGGGAQMIGKRSNGNSIMFRRKVMNSWICCTDRSFQFVGLMNEDVNTVLTHGRRGALFLTIMQLMLTQIQTQANAGGATDIYRKFGTYVKSFYSVMYAPSCVKVSTLADYRAETIAPRFHHMVNWNAAAPRIVRESIRKPA
jgi:hypothetical protein